MAWITNEEFLDAVELFRGDLIEAARRNCMSSADVEDAVQCAVFTRMKQLEAYDPEKSSLKTWVTKQVIWAAQDMNYQHERDMEPEQAEITWDVQMRPETDKPYDARYASNEPSYDPKTEIRYAVHEALAKLDPEDKTVATAYYLEEYTLEECAYKLGVPLRTLERRIKGIKKQLQALLS